MAGSSSCSEQQRLVRDFAANFPGQKLAAVWTRYEGSPSIDGRYWGLMAEDENWLPIAFLVYDRMADRIVSLREMRNVPGIKEGLARSEQVVLIALAVAESWLRELEGAELFPGIRRFARVFLRTRWSLQVQDALQNVTVLHWTFARPPPNAGAGSRPTRAGGRV